MFARLALCQKRVVFKADSPEYMWHGVARVASGLVLHFRWLKSAQISGKVELMCNCTGGAVIAFTAAWWLFQEWIVHAKLLHGGLQWVGTVPIRPLSFHFHTRAASKCVYIWKKWLT
jgi:hypothetical protein